MSRYDIGGEGIEAFEPGSDGRALRNKRRIVDPEEMDIVEARALRQAIDESLDTFENSTRFTMEILSTMHRSWLGDIYDFAGEIRTVNVSKGGIMFAPAAYLGSTLGELDEVLRSHTPCEGMDRAGVVSAIALVHGEFVLAHPFREGNGRVGRWLADLMAVQAGFPPLDWGFDGESGQKRGDYFAAMARAYAKDYGPLEKLISLALKDS